MPVVEIPTPLQKGIPNWGPRWGARVDPAAPQLVNFQQTVYQPIIYYKTT